MVTVLVSSSTTTTETKRYKTKNSERTTDLSGKFLCFQSSAKTVNRRFIKSDRPDVDRNTHKEAQSVKADCMLSGGKSNLTVLLALSSKDFYLDKEEYNSELQRDLYGALLIYTICH